MEGGCDAVVQLGDCFAACGREEGWGVVMAVVVEQGREVCFEGLRAGRGWMVEVGRWTEPFPSSSIP